MTAAGPLDREAVVRRLSAEGGPFLKLRVARLMGAGGEVLAPLIDAVLATQAALAVLHRLDGRVDFAAVHGAKAGCFENAAHDLVALGLDACTPAVRARLQPYLDHLAQTPDGPEPEPFNRFRRTVIAAGLARAGLGAEPPVRERLRARLDAVHELLRDGLPEVFVEPAARGRLPAAFADRGLIRDKVYDRGELRLPWIHDLIGWAAMLADLPPHDRRRIDAVAAAILSPAYQALPAGYGVLKAPNRRVYAMGWSVKLLDPNVALKGRAAAHWLFQMQTLAPFATVRGSRWFQAGLDHFDTHRDDDGLWRLPIDYLRAQPDVYRVAGGRLPLAGGSAARAWESTFIRLALEVPLGGG